MQDITEWEWHQEEAARFSGHGAIEAHGAYALGELSVVVILGDDDDEMDSDDDDSGQSPVWNVYSVMTSDRDGFNGLEHLDGFESLAEAKAFGDTMRAELVEMVREDPLTP